MLDERISEAHEDCVESFLECLNEINLIKSQLTLARGEERNNLMKQLHALEHQKKPQIMFMLEYTMR